MGDTIPHPDNDEINRVANLLIAEWCRVEKIAKPNAPLSDGSERLNVTYIANFADMARVVIADRRTRWPDPAEDVVKAALAKAQAVIEWDAYEADSRDDNNAFVCVECNARPNVSPDLEPSPLCNLCAQTYAMELAGVLPKLAGEAEHFATELAKANAKIGGLERQLADAEAAHAARPGDPGRSRGASKFSRRKGGRR